MDNARGIELIRTILELLVAKLLKVVGFDVTMDGIDEYLRDINRMYDVKVCSKFKCNSDVINATDPASTSITTMLDAMRCVMCRCFVDSHVQCGKYNGTGEFCETCGRDLRDHIRQKSSTTKCCGVYEKSTLFDDCSTCYHGKGDHMYNDTYWNLSKEGQQIVTDNMSKLCVYTIDAYDADLTVMVYINNLIYRSNWNEMLKTIT